MDVPPAFFGPVAAPVLPPSTGGFFAWPPPAPAPAWPASTATAMESPSVFDARMLSAPGTRSAAEMDDMESPFQFNPGMLSSPASSRSSITSSSGEEVPPVRPRGQTLPLPPRPPTRYAHSSPPRRSDSDDLLPPPPVLSPGQQTFTDLAPLSFHHTHTKVRTTPKGHARSYSTPFAPFSPAITLGSAFPSPIPGPGVTRDVTPGFLHLRLAALSRPERKAAAQERERSLQRWRKLLALHRCRQSWWFSAHEVRSGEKDLVRWVPDDAPEARRCALCAHALTLRRRRHHCRLCGQCVCGGRECSQLVTIQDLVPAPPPFQGLVTRVCASCSTLRDHLPLPPPEWVGQHASLLLLETEISELLDKYLNQLELTEQDSQHKSDALRARSQLLLRCDQYERLIHSLPRDGVGDTRRVCQGIYLRAAQFLEKYRTIMGTSPRWSRPLPQGVKREEHNAFLAVLSEQAVQVRTLLLQATEELRADDQATLQLSLDELIGEIERVHAELAES